MRRGLAGHRRGRARLAASCSRPPASSGRRGAVDWRALHRGSAGRASPCRPTPSSASVSGSTPVPRPPATAGREPAASASAPADGASPPGPDGAPLSWRRPQHPMARASSTADAQARARRRLKDLLEEVRPRDRRDRDGERTSWSWGSTRLTLTQVALQVQKELRRQGHLPADDGVALEPRRPGEHLDAQLPPGGRARRPARHRRRAQRRGPDGTTQVARAPSLAAVLAGCPARSPDLSSALIDQQLLLMQQQLAVAGGRLALATVPGPAVAAPAATAPAIAPPAPRPRRRRRRRCLDATSDEPDGQISTTSRRRSAPSRASTRHHEELTPKQQAPARGLRPALHRADRESKEFTQRNREVLADPRAVTGFRPAIKELVYPIVVERSKGANLWDLDGNEYVDVLNGFGMQLLRLAARLRHRGGQGAARPRHRDRPADAACRRGRRAVLRLTGSTAPPSATPAPRR